MSDRRSSDASKGSRAAHEPGSLRADPSEPARGVTNLKGGGFHTWVDTTNKVLQIVALLCAAAWTLSLFIETGVPALESKYSLSPELNWASMPGDDNVCDGMLSVRLTNDSQRPLNVENVRLTGWLFDPSSLPRPRPEKPTLFEYQQICDEGTVFYDGSADPLARDLHGHYAPGASVKSEAHFSFAKSKGKLVLLSVDVNGRAQGPLGFGSKVQNNHAWTWDWVCGLDAQLAGPSPGGRK